jgi:hypothetical protein
MGRVETGVLGAAPHGTSFIPTLAYASPNPMWWWKAPKLFGGQPTRSQQGPSGLGPLRRRERDGGSGSGSGSSSVSLLGRASTSSSNTALLRPSGSSLSVVIESPLKLPHPPHPPRSAGLDGELAVDDTA